MSYRLLKYGNRLITGSGGGVEFPHVHIGNLDWMSVNLAVDDGGEGIHREESVVSTYGGGLDMGTQYYYSADAAFRVTANIGGGWRMPTIEDINDLLVAVGTAEGNAHKLISTQGWQSGSIGQGTNEYGLNIVPSGYYRSQGTSWHPDPYVEIGFLGGILSSTTIESNKVYFMNCQSSSPNIQVGRENISTMNVAWYQVRLVRDHVSIEERLLKKEV
jgi:uncharacterized protein (TIGR02145 family)